MQTAPEAAEMAGFPGKREEKKEEKTGPSSTHFTELFKERKNKRKRKELGLISGVEIPPERHAVSA